MNRNLRWRISPFVLSPMVCGVLTCFACGAFSEAQLQAETAAPANAVSPTGTPPAAPQTEELTPRNLHVWGRFDAGTWKQVRIVADTLNPRGQVVDTSTTDIKTTLLRADAKRLTLRIEATVDVNGRRFECPPQTVEYGYYDESPGQPTELKSLGSAPLTVDGRQVPCRIQQVVAETGREKQVTQLFLSDNVEPYVLKRETHVFTADGKSSLDPQTTVEVIALDMPYKVLREMKSTAYERTIQRTSKGSNVTLDVICVDVPGGIVARTSKELNSDGRLVRRSMLEMVDYHVVDNDDDGSADNNSAGNSSASNGSANNGNADNGNADNSGDKNSAQNLTRRQAKRARKSGRD